MSDDAGFGPDGIHDADRAWLAQRINDPPHIPEIGPCFAIHNGERLGPFRRRREAQAALDRKLVELERLGVDLLAAGISQAIVFEDPTPEENHNG